MSPITFTPMTSPPPKLEKTYTIVENQLYVNKLIAFHKSIVNSYSKLYTKVNDGLICEATGTPFSYKNDSGRTYMILLYTFPNMIEVHKKLQQLDNINHQIVNTIKGIITQQKKLTKYQMIYVNSLYKQYKVLLHNFSNIS